MVVKLVEKGVFGFLGYRFIVIQSIRHVVSSHSIEQELVVCLILLLLFLFVLVFDLGANKVPKRITYKSLEMWFLD